MHREDPEGNETLGEQELWEFWLQTDPGFSNWLDFIDEQGKEHADRHRNQDRPEQERQAKGLF